MEYSVGLNWILILIGIAITVGSQIYIKQTYKKTDQISSKKGKNGQEVARKILDSNALSSVKIGEVADTLADHYDPRNKTVTLSTDVYRKDSLAAISVAAHECGHAIQDKEGYLFLRIRRTIIPVVNLASSLGYVIIMIGLFAGLTGFIWIGIFLEFVILFFQLITLPVEFDASKRGLKQLQSLGLIEENEKAICKKMLIAAALTYVASVATSILEIARLMLLARRND